jgi:hypothetical protein
MPAIPHTAILLPLHTRPACALYPYPSGSLPAHSAKESGPKGAGVGDGSAAHERATLDDEAEESSV